jgi:tRNA(Ile)-lysidine synthase
MSAPQQQLIDRTRSRISELAPRNAPLLLAVSGGLDSMVLLKLAVAASAAEPRELAVAHMDHGLRGAAGQADAQLVQSTVAQLGLRFFLETLAPDALRTDHAGSPEEAARTCRYRFLERIAQEHGFPFVAVAHHADDQAETVLFNIVRGTGLGGLRGMRDQRPLSSTVRLIRPLLEFTRADLRSFAADCLLPYAGDASNSSPEFTRNRLRNHILPLLRESMNPAVDQALVRLARQAAEQLQCLDATADQLLALAILDCSEFTIRLSRSRLLQSPEPLIRHALIRLWDRQAWPRQRMTSDHWLRMTALLQRPSSLSLPQNILAESRADLLILRRH